eukprot:s4182_g2.t1
MACAIVQRSLPCTIALTVRSLKSLQSIRRKLGEVVVLATLGLARQSLDLLCLLRGNHESLLGEGSGVPPKP